MVTNKEYEDEGVFPLAEIECLYSDLENLLKSSKKVKNKNKIDKIVNVATEDIIEHLGKLEEALEKTQTQKSLYDEKEYKDLLL